MTTLSRETLKALFNFQDGTIPSGDDFSNLIDSVLVVRDDQFFGKWSPDVGYKTGDIVIYGNAFYTFLSKEHALSLDPACDCDADCCKNQTPEQCCRWQKLDLCTGGDSNWVKCDDNTMYAKVYGKVGIGTECSPAAFFHLSDAGSKSELLFNPVNTSQDKPLLKMTRKPGPIPQVAAAAARTVSQPAPGVDLFVSEQIESTIQTADSDPLFRVTFQTNTLGYLFRRITDAAAGETADVTENLALLFIGSTPDRPRIGIGTTTPEAALDIKEHGKGQIILEPGERRDPEIILINLHPSDAQNQLTIKVGSRMASFATDAPEGFVFRKGQPYPPGNRSRHGHDDHARHLASIDLEGNIYAHGLYVEPVDSDGRPIQHALNTIAELEPIQHREGHERQFGFTSENIRDVLPQAYKNFPGNAGGIAYHDLVALLVKAVQELSEEVDHLKRRLRHSE